MTSLDTDTGRIEAGRTDAAERVQSASTAPAITLEGVEKVYRTDKIETVALDNIKFTIRF